MSRRLHELERGIEERLEQGPHFFSRIALKIAQLLAHTALTFHHVWYVIFLPAHKSFQYFHELHPVKGYTQSYHRHVRHKRVMRMSAGALLVVHLVQVGIVGLLIQPRAAFAASCSISGSTTVDQTYINTNSCQDIHITGNATITFTGAINLSGTGVFYVDSGITATFSGAFNLSDSADALVINGTVTHANADSTGVNITAATVTISSTGSINVNSKGCQVSGGANGYGPNGSNVCTITTAGYGVGTNSSARGGGGAAYGGNGGTGTTGAGGTQYGSATAPTLQGSSGGSAGTTAVGGAGGGLIQLTVSGTLSVSGSVTANGGNGSTNGTSQAGGGGSGGGISISADTISGSGFSFSVNGGNGADNTSQDGGGGGGGRISIRYTSGTPAFSSSNLTASAGTAPSGSAVSGSKGTVYVKKGTSPSADITIYHGFAYDNTDYAESSFTMDSSATNQYCTSAAVSPSIIVATLSLGGTLTCSPSSLTSFNFSASSAFSISSSTTLSVTTVNSTVDFNIPAGSSQTWTSFNFTGAIQGAFTVDDAVSVNLVSSTITANTSFTNLTTLGVDSGSTISANAKGCYTATSGGYGPNTSTNVCAASTAGYGTGQASGVTGAPGGGHGGTGGSGSTSALAVGTTYGSAIAPVLFGSSGGSGNNNVQNGGIGGGRVRLDVSGTATINGSVTANGGNGNTNGGTSATGGGSGGSIYLTTATLAMATGTLTASGGAGAAGSTQFGGGGGGGRIAVVYTAGTPTLSSSVLTVPGGSATSTGVAGVKGTVYVKKGTSPSADITIYHGFTYDDVDHAEGTWTVDSTATNQYCASSAVSPSITVATLSFSGTLTCSASGLTSFNFSASTTFSLASSTSIAVTTRASTVDFNIPAGSNQTWTSLTLTGALQGSFTINDAISLTLVSSTITANTSFTNLTELTIDSNSSISANTLGCSTVTGNGYGPNTSTNVCAAATSGYGTASGSATGTGGGGHGGTGGAGSGGSMNGGIAYDSPTAPVLFGSSGGSANNNVQAGGIGGGAIRLDVSGTLTINGNISANGGAGSTNSSSSASGGGAGGSIYITTTTLVNTATLSVNGGAGAAGSTQFGGGGGGGRIAVVYTTGTPTLNSTVLAATGGSATSTGVAGSKGTVYVKKGTSPSADVTIYHGFSYDDTDYVESTWTEDSSATNQYCTSGAATPSITADTITVSGTTSCTVSTITSFNLSATSNFVLSSNTSFSVTAVSSTVDFNIPAGSSHTWSSFAFTGGLRGDFTIDDAISMSLVGSTIAGNVSWTNLNTLSIDASSSISANAKGCYTATSGGYGPNTSTNVCTISTSGYGTASGSATGTGGGGHGGTGGAGSGGSMNGGITYGSATAPVLFGSSGGSTNNNSQNGGIGGGKIRLDATGTMTINGSVTANGGAGNTTTTSAASGGGSGGSIYVTTGTIAGSSVTITASGGAGAVGSTAKGGGGGGGRVSIRYGTDSSSWLSGLSAAIVAAGGSATSSAVGGSVGTFNASAFSTSSTPSITAPTSGATGQSVNITVTSSAYSSDGLSHVSSDWQISDDNTFSDADCSDTNIVYCSMTSSNLISIDVTAANGTFQNARSGQTTLAANTVYYVRVRYTNAAGSSSWSSSVAFTTYGVPATPSISTPTSGAIAQSVNLTVTSSIYSSDGLSHTTSDWQISDDSTFSDADCSDTNIVYCSMTSSNLISIDVTAANGTFQNARSGQTTLAANTTYYVRVRYTNTAGSSVWSSSISFTTYGIPVTPTIVTPTAAATAQSFNLTVTSSTYSSDGLSHTTSDWQISDNDTFSTTDCSDTNIVYCSMTSSNLISIDVTAANGTFQNARAAQTTLAGNTTYYVRVRYTNAAGSSSWSSSVAFTTYAVPQIPSITAPTSGAINQSRTLTVTSSTYSSDGLSHTTSDWQISDNNTFSDGDCSDTNIVYCSFTSGNLTSIMVNGANGTFQNALNSESQLAAGEMYYVRVRYTNTAGSSVWSSSISFTTVGSTTTSSDLSTSSFGSWAWMGFPVDQAGGIGGAATESTLGWIHLNCESWSTCAAGVYNSYPRVTIDVETGEVNGWAWVGNAQADSGTAYSVGWLNFDPAPLADATYADALCTGPNYYPAPPCHAAEIDTSNQQEISGWARFETLATYGDTMLGTTGKNNDWGWVLLRGTNTADNDDFGLTYNGATLDGWVWSGGGTLPAAGGFSNAVGFGWINFSSAGTGSATGPATAYASTAQGNVYSKGGLENPSGTLSPSQYNATYLILSSDSSSVVNFNSELLGEGTFTATDWEDLDIPDATNGYTGSLGSIDVTKLTTVTSGSTNVYGNTVTAMTNFDSFSGDEFLDGGVRVVGATCCSGSYAIDNSITFTNGTALPSTGSTFDGSGVIVVNGDLTINSNLYYNNTALLDIKNLASVAWIIRGDLTIGANVSQLVGSFFVIGDTNIGDDSHDGEFLTVPTDAQQLVIYGLVMARTFTLGREYQGTSGIDEPSELFYYDGRILGNTPPGLREYTSILPVITP